MTMSENQPIPFPPFAAVRYGEETQQANRQTVCRLRADIVLIEKQLSSSNAPFTRITGPTSEELQSFPIETICTNLQSIAASLHTMGYPSELTSWINRNRNLIDRLVESGESCFDLMQRLYHLRPGTAAYHDRLGTLRRRLGQMVESLKHLRGYFDQYLEEAPPEAEERIDFRWEVGRQAGLYEAADLSQRLLDEAHAICGNLPEQLTQLPETLRMAARAAASETGILSIEGFRLDSNK
jgi:hypothetical protein